MFGPRLAQGWHEASLRRPTHAVSSLPAGRFLYQVCVIYGTHIEYGE